MARTASDDGTTLETYAEIIRAIRQPGTRLEVYCTALDTHVATPQGPVLVWLRLGAKEYGRNTQAVSAWGDPLHVVHYDDDNCVSFR